MGAIYYNRGTEWLISQARNISKRSDIWPLIRLVMAVMYGRGKSQWPISSVFIRTLINEKPSNISDTMKNVATICRLVSYEEIITD